MTSFAFAPSLSFGEGSNGIGGFSRDTGFGSLFSSPFSDTDPIMRGIRDGSLSWAEAAELEAAELEELEAARMPVALFSAAPTAPITPIAAPTTPPRPRVTFACPGAPPRLNKPITYSKPCKTIILRNLPRDSDDLAALLLKAFSPYGTVRDVYIPKNMDASSPYFGTIKGFALIKFAELPAAEAAEAAGSLRIGRKNLSVEFAKEDR